MNKTTFDTRIDEAIFGAVVAKGVRENGTVIDLDTLIVDRQKLEANIRTLFNDTFKEAINKPQHCPYSSCASHTCRHWEELKAEQHKALATILGGSEDE